MSNLMNESMANNKSARKLIISKLFCLKNFNFVLLFVVIAGGLYYLAGVNDLTVKGFNLQELQKKSDQLAAENKDIELKVVALESYDNILARAQNLSMISAGEISYVTPGSGVVARR